MKVELDEFQVIADEAWSQVLEVKAMPMEQRQRRQAGYGKPQPSGYSEVQLPKSYSLPNTYEKPDARNPVCCMIFLSEMLECIKFLACSSQNNCPDGPREFLFDINLTDF